jgi:hypothetical protein
VHLCGDVAGDGALCGLGENTRAGNGRVGAIPERIHHREARREIARIDGDPAVGPAGCQSGRLDDLRRPVDGNTDEQVVGEISGLQPGQVRGR